MFPWQGEFSIREVFLAITSAAAKFLFYLFIILFQYHAIIFLQESWASIIFLSHKCLLRSMLCRFQTMSRVGLGRFSGSMGSGTYTNVCLPFTGCTGARDSSWVPWHMMLYFRTPTKVLLLVNVCLFIVWKGGTFYAMMMLIVLLVDCFFCCAVLFDGLPLDFCFCFWVKLSHY